MTDNVTSNDMNRVTRDMGDVIPTTLTMWSPLHQQCRAHYMNNVIPTT